MRAARRTGLSMLVLAVLPLAVTALGGELPPPAAAPDAAGAAPAPARADVPMVELTVQGRHAVGRIVAEDEDVIRVESLDGGIVGYQVKTVEEMRRFAMPEAAYEELKGDHHHRRAWEADDTRSDINRARFYYQQALFVAEGQQRERLNAKLAVLQRDLAEWQAQQQVAAELAKAQREAELAQAEAQLTRERIAAIQRQEQQLKDLGRRADAMQTDMQRLADALNRLAADVAELEDDVDDLRNLDQVFIRSTIFYDLKRSHDRLNDEVERLRRQVRRD